MLSLVRWLSGWPLWLLHALGGWLGWAAHLLSRPYRQRLVDNARQAGIAAGERRAAVAEAGRLVAELPRLWLQPRLADPVFWQGEELIESLLGRPGGLVLLTPHLGSFEVSAQAYAERFGARQPMTVMYRPARQPWLRELEATTRERPGLTAVPATVSGVRQMLRALKKGETVGLLPDQVPPEGMGVWAPFFGRSAYTMTLASRLAQQSGAPLAVLWTERLPRGSGYVVHAVPCEALPASGDDAAAAAINRTMEAVILRCPRQYLWGYHRYKSPRRPEAA